MGAAFPEWMPPHWLCYFAVEDTDAAVEKIRASGGAVSNGPNDSEYGCDQGAAGCGAGDGHPGEPGWVVGGVERAVHSVVALDRAGVRAARSSFSCWSRVLTVGVSDGRARRAWSMRRVFSTDRVWRFRVAAAVRFAAVCSTLPALAWARA